MKTYVKRRKISKLHPIQFIFKFWVYIQFLDIFAEKILVHTYIYQRTSIEICDVTLLILSLMSDFS